MKSVLILLSLPLMLLTSGCESTCANQVLQEIPSPDKKLKAVVFQRDCGATTGFSTHVSVIKADEKLQNAKGDVLSIDTDHGKAPSGPGGGPAVAVVWKELHQLQIAHPQSARIFLAAKEIQVTTGIFSSESIQITYSSVK